MPSKIQAISPLVDRLMRLIGRAQCVAGAEPDIELAIREALLHFERGGSEVHMRKRLRSMPCS
jgi:hypothetical protein